MSQTLVKRAAELVDRPVSRRGFLRRFTMVATALSVAPVSYLLRPGTAYAAICTCSGRSCDCGATCCDGYTEFCCSMYGVNACPAGTIPAGWWKADGSGVCDATAGPQPRYYIDCNVADCGSCGCGGSGTCSGGCANPRSFFCGCGNGDCGLRKAGCTQFRYGQCNQGAGCVGPIACRVVTCTPPWVWDASCTTTSATDNNTRFHNAACLNETGAWPAGAPVVGDWTGSGRDMPGVFANGTWYLKRSDGGPDIIFDFGVSTDLPVVGDWNGDGIDTPGVVRAGQWFLRDSNSTGSADRSFWFGNPGDTPFAGDWTGNGFDKPGLYRRSDGFVYLRNSLTQGIADIRFFFGNPGDLPLAGDFNGDGRDSVSLYRPSEQRFYIMNRLGANNGGLGAADLSFSFGNPGDRPLVGDWDGNGIAGPGVYRNRGWYLRNENSSGPHDIFI
ncbi:MAG: hypothetical protein M3P87_09610 [Actinomycetota bacterium]|nr:hypothetical protein [Actinomycetota bacterium]